MNIPWKVVGFILAIIVFQIIAYFGVELIEGAPHNVKRKIDDRIPLIPWTGIIYSTWFPLIGFAPLAIYYGSFQVFQIYIIAWIIDIILSSAAYLIYPTSFERPPVKSGLIKAIYKASFKQINCAPSLHCSVSYLVIAGCIAAEGLSPALAALFIADSIGICITTLTTKQHVLIDVISAVPFAVISWLIAVQIGTSGIIDNLFAFLAF